MPGPSAVNSPKAVWETEVTNEQGGDLGTIVRIFTCFTAAVTMLWKARQFWKQVAEHPFASPKCTD